MRPGGALGMGSSVSREPAASTRVAILGLVGDEHGGRALPLHRS